MFIEHKQEAIGQFGNRKDVNGARTLLTEQIGKEMNQGRVFTGKLIGIVCSSENFNLEFTADIMPFSLHNIFQDHFNFESQVSNSLSLFQAGN